MWITFIVFNITFNNISVISWQSVLLVEETGENHRPATSHLQTLSHIVIVVIGTDCIGSCKSNYHMIMTTTALDYMWIRHRIVVRHKRSQWCKSMLVWSTVYYDLVPWYSQVKTFKFGIWCCIKSKHCWLIQDNVSQVEWHVSGFWGFFLHFSNVKTFSCGGGHLRCLIDKKIKILRVPYKEHPSTIPSMLHTVLSLSESTIGPSSHVEMEMKIG